MYICRVTGKVSERGEKLNKIVVATREKVYYKKVKNEDTNKWEDVECGRGWEVVKELNATDEGVLEYNNMSDAQRSAFLKAL